MHECHCETHCEGELDWILPVDRGRGLKRVGMGQEGSGMGRMEGESTGRDIWNLGASWNELEILSNGNSQVSVRVTLAKTPSNGGYGA